MDSSFSSFPQPDGMGITNPNDQENNACNQEAGGNELSAKGEPEKELCGDFQRGRCFRTACKYSHQFRDGERNSNRRMREDGRRDECRDFMRGRCHRGFECRYAHPGGGYDPYYDHPPPFSGYPPPPPHYYDPPPPWYMDSYYPPHDYGMRGMPRHHDEVCRDFLSGKCNRGSSCRFVHKKEICGDYLRGDCRRSGCRYSHNKEEGERCLDYQRGKCSRGDDCRYYHDNNQPTELCRDFLANRCGRGNDCKFLHDEEELAKKRKLNDPEIQESGITVKAEQTQGFDPDESGRPSKMIKS